MQKWNYRVVVADGLNVTHVKLDNTPETEDLRDHLLKLGLEGWELVTAASEPGCLASHILYFKRPLD